MATDGKLPQGVTLDLRDQLASGALKAEALVDRCLKRIAEKDGEINAWAWIDEDYARAEARRLDAYRASGMPTGPLHGIPVGVKDIIDTARIPTENGCALDAGRVPAHDAAVVELLKRAGALVLGKTVTTELAYLQPSGTRNPANTMHTPGGSSSGSAAAVADGMVPLSIGTQTGGSVIRPASYCGVTGFKPTFGSIPRRGILAQAPSLDTVGVMSPDPLGAALLAEALFGHDAEDSSTGPAPAPRLLETASSKPPLKPVFAFVRLPGHDEADPDTKEAFRELVAALGDQAFEIDLPPLFQDVAHQHRTIQLAELARSYHHYDSRGFDQLGPITQQALTEGKAILARDYLAALDWRKLLNSVLDEVFTRCDAIICPAAPGPAPEGFGSTGSAIFNGLFTLAGTPAVTIPLLTASNGLPMGVQLVGRRYADGRLLRTAHWLYSWADAI